MTHSSSSTPHPSQKKLQLCSNRMYFSFFRLLCYRVRVKYSTHLLLKLDSSIKWLLLERAFCLPVSGMGQREWDQEKQQRGKEGQHPETWLWHTRCTHSGPSSCPEPFSPSYLLLSASCPGNCLALRVIAENSFAIRHSSSSLWVYVTFFKFHSIVCSFSLLINYFFRPCVYDLSLTNKT